jgi:hypothetical protein
VALEFVGHLSQLLLLLVYDGCLAVVLPLEGFLSDAHYLRLLDGSLFLLVEEPSKLYNLLLFHRCLVLKYSAQFLFVGLEPLGVFSHLLLLVS